MRTKWKKTVAAVLAGILLVAAVPTDSLAAPATGNIKNTGLQTGQVALYQDGALSSAYTPGEYTEKYTAPEAGTAEETIYNGLKNLDSSIQLGDYKLSAEEAAELYRSVINSNPDLFFVSNVNSYGYLTYCNDCDGWIGQTADSRYIKLAGPTATSGYYCDHEATHSCYTAVTQWYPRYIAEKDEVASMVDDFDAAVQKALDGIDDSMTDLEKALYCHDYIIKLNSYDYDNFLKDTVPDSGHSAYGALVLNKSVCDGYALAFSYLMNKCGINTRLVSSESMAHAWNAIELDGSWYFADLTYDDPVYSYMNSSARVDKFDSVGHGGFLASKDKLSATQYSGSLYTGWAQTDIVADNTQYDNAVWKTNQNEYGYCDGYWYYLDETSYEIMKTEDVTKDGEVFSSEIKNAADTWPYRSEPGNMTYIGSFGKASVHTAGKRLYFSLEDSIYSYDLTKENPEKELFYTKTSTDTSIYGLSVVNDILTYGLAASPSDKAETFTVKLEISPGPNPGTYSKGDVDGQTGITANDALVILKAVVGAITLSDEQSAAADVDGEAGVTANDALLVLKYVVGSITEF